MNGSRRSPYAPPRTAVEDIRSASPPRRRFWILSVMATMLSIVLGLMGTFIVPAFKDVYASFGADLPSATATVLHGAKWSWLPTTVALGFSLLWVIKGNPVQGKTARRIRNALIALCVADIVMFIYVIRALYLPIFYLGSVV